jgi:hypothetical protein
MKKTSILGIFFITLLLLAAQSASAQEGVFIAAVPPDEVTATDVRETPGIGPNWGTTSRITKTITSLSCMPLFSSQTYSFAGSTRYCTSGTCTFICNVDIPTGAAITYLEIDGCDSNNTEEIRATLGRAVYNNAGGVPIALEHVESGLAYELGCSFWWNTLSSPVPVDNWHNNYFIQVTLGSNSITTTFSAIRIGYILQISPAPAEATFNDVSTSHPLFQYIEALAASGITTGYDDDTYRPSQYITRGQMAVFLSRALGLHWPN